MSLGKKEKTLILYNIRSAYNVGAIFRTADACGIDKIYLVGYTPAPVDEFGRNNMGIAKTAIGAEKSVVWEKTKTISPLLKKLKQAGFLLVAVEQANQSIDYKQVKLKYPCALVVGEEVHGLTPSILSTCDIVAEIPMKGQKESLNVSVATGIALFRLLGI